MEEERDLRIVKDVDGIEHIIEFTQDGVRFGGFLNKELVPSPGDDAYEYALSFNRKVYELWHKKYK